MSVTYPVQKSRNASRFLTPPSVDGLIKAGYQSYGLTTQGNVYTKELLLKRHLDHTVKTSVKRLCMPGSAARTREKTLSDKLKTCVRTSQPIELSRTLAQESTSNDQACKPFWNSQCLENSQKLWLCTGTDWQDLGSSCLRQSSKGVVPNSWFSVKITQPLPENLRKTCSQSQPSLWRATTEREAPPTVKDAKPLDSTKKLPPGKARKIRVYPTKEQQGKLAKWMGVARWTYNRCVASLTKRECVGSKKALRALHLNKDALQQTPWVTDVPYDIRDEAMNDVLKAVKSNIALKRARFSLKFRSRKDLSQSLVVLSKHWGHSRGIYADVLGGKVLKSSEPLPEKLGYDSRLVRNSLGQWFLCLPLPLSVSENQAPVDELWTDGVISLDPGVRTFVTGYDPSGLVCEWGKNDIGRIYRLCHTLDKLHSKWSQKTLRHRKRYRLKKAGKRIRLKIRNLVDEFHKKLSTWLCKNYRVILLPKFETSTMIRRGQRKIGSRTVRSMVTWSHYRFRQRLISKSREYSWCNVVLCDESFTSKTCTNCGVLNHSLGGSKVFACNACNLVIDRDVNGARNILLSYISSL